MKIKKGGGRKGNEQKSPLKDEEILENQSKKFYSKY